MVCTPAPLISSTKETRSELGNDCWKKYFSLHRLVMSRGWTEARERIVRWILKLEGVWGYYIHNKIKCLLLWLRVCVIHSTVLGHRTGPEPEGKFGNGKDESVQMFVDPKLTATGYRPTGRWRVDVPRRSSMVDGEKVGLKWPIKTSVDWLPGQYS